MNDSQDSTTHPPSPIAVWLESIEFAQYASTFEENHISLETLADLTGEDLKECGVTSLGHRKKLLAEIAKLKAGAAPSVERAHNVPSTGEKAAPEGEAPAPPRQVDVAKGGASREFRAPAPAPAPVAIAPSPRIEKIRPGAPKSAPRRSVASAPNITTASSAETQTQPSSTSYGAPARKRVGFWATLFASKFLFISIVAHLVFGLGATYFIVQRIQAKRKVTFQGGPPSTNPSKRALEHKVSMAQKKKTGGAPPQAKRIVSAGIAKVSLPDLPTIPTASSVVPGMMAGMGGVGTGLGMGFGSGMGSGMGGGGGGGGAMSFFGFRGAGAGLHGSFYDLKQTHDKKASGINANNYTALVRKWVDGGMKESELAKYFKAPATLAAAQFMIPDMPADEAPKAYGVEKEVKPAQWIAVYRGKVQPPKEGTYHFIGAADDVLLVKVNGKLVLDGSWADSSGLKPEAIIPPQYVGFPRKGYVMGAGVHFGTTDWAEMEVVIGERPGGHFWAVLMAEPSGGGGKGKAMPLFRTGAVKLPETKAPPFPNCDLNGPLWRVQPASGGSLLDALKRP